MSSPVILDVHVFETSSLLFFICVVILDLIYYCSPYTVVSLEEHLFEYLKCKIELMDLALNYVDKKLIA